MPRYYFHLRDDLNAKDEEGTELPDLEAARAQAIREVQALAAASVLEERKINLHHGILIADEAGEVLLTVEFGDVVRVEA